MVGDEFLNEALELCVGSGVDAAGFLGLEGYVDDGLHLGGRASHTDLLGVSFNLFHTPLLDAKVGTGRYGDGKRRHCR